MQVQDIWIHFLTLAVCAASCGVAVYTLIRTYNSHSWQSISILVRFITGTLISEPQYPASQRFNF